MDESKRIVEIHGTKVEVDLRTARTVETYKVGDPVKVLKKRYSDSYEVMPGAIVGFAEFTALPTVEVVCVNHNGDVEFIAYNDKSEGVELAPMNRYEMAFDQGAIEAKLIREVEKAQANVRELEAKLEAYRKEVVRAFALS